MKIYFAGSIMGGREKQQDYANLINYLKKFGTVLTEHIGKEDTHIKNEVKYSEKIDEHTYIRDTKWIVECDIIIADVSVPSLGVGYELGFGESLNKDIVCIYDNNSQKSLSYMLSGNVKNEIIKYDSLEDIKEKITEYFSKRGI